MAGHYTNFIVSVYGVGRGANPDRWASMTNQLPIDKVYIEVQRDRNMASDENLESAKKFYLDMGVKVAGGMALSASTAGGQFVSFCYTDPADREFIKGAAQRAARHFDEVIQDDFGHRGQRQPDLDPVPPRSDAGCRPESAGGTGQGSQSNSQNGHQVSKLV
jgi:hypothetical protein